MFYKIELNNLMSICGYLHFSINRKYNIVFSGYLSYYFN